MEALSTEILIGIILLLVLISSYFSGSETAFMAIDHYRLKYLAKKKNSAAARKVMALLERPDRLLGVILIGNNLVNILAASLATLVGLRLLGEWGALAATAVLTAVFLVFAEVTPKTVAAYFPERIAFISVYILQPLMKIMHPLVVATGAVSNQLARLFGVKKHAKAVAAEVLSNEELRSLVLENAAISGKGESMLSSILDLEQITVDDIMVPASEMVTLDINQDLSSIVQQICNAQHTRIPVVKGSTDRVLGILHMRAAGHFLTEPEKSKAALLLRADEEPRFVPEGTDLLTQLINFQKTKSRISLVVDEYGKVRGLIALEDILEEIVGQFTTNIDEYIGGGIRPGPDGTYLIDGGMPLRQINRALNWHLPLQGPKTLSGLVIDLLETIPGSNLCTTKDGYRFETVQVSDNMIRLLKVSTAEAEEEKGQSLHILD